MKRLLCSAIVGLVAFMCLSASVRAASIPIPNAGFEERATFDPFEDGTDKYNQYKLEYWRHFECDNNGGPLRIWNPGVPGVHETTQGALDVGFGGNAPEGDYVVVVRSRYNDNEMPEIRPIRDFEAAVQILETTFDPAMVYTLTAKVGRLPNGAAEGGSENYTPAWFGYAIQLAVGGTNVDGARYQGRVEGGTVIAEDVNSLTVPVNGFVTATAVYTPDPAYEHLAGQPLQIRLCALEKPDDHSLTGWAVFDDVELDAMPDPNAPSVDAGPDMISWSGQAVQLDPNVVNNDVTPLTFAWSAEPAENVVFDPSADVEAPTVTITRPATVTKSITVGNAGFEDPVLEDGGDEPNPPSWTDGYYDVADPNVWVADEALAGVYNPTAAMGYGGVVPEGENAGYTTAHSSRDRGLSQVLSATLEANTRYELSVLVGNPYLFNGSTTTANYRVELLAGGVLLASDTGPSPANDQTWKTATVVYDSGEEPAQLGEPLEIRLLACAYTDGKGVDFDDVQLTAESPAPEPYVVTLTLAVNNEGSGRPNVTDDMTIDVYDDTCKAAKAAGLQEANPGDIDGNCITDANDLDILVSKWANDIALAGPIPKGQVQVGLVPNGKFQLYKPGTNYTVTAVFVDSYAKGVGDNLTVLGGGVAEYSDGTSGGVVDCPGWVGPVEGSKTNDLTGAGLPGYEDDGSSCLNVFGTWSGGQGNMIESVPLGDTVPSAVYTLSAMVRGSAGPLVFDLLVDDEVVTPTTSVDPIGPDDPADDWEEISRTYEDVPSGEMKIRVGTPNLGKDNLYGTRTRIDNITLTFEITDPNIPEVDAGVDMITWSGEPVQLDPNIVEQPGLTWTNLTYLWTAEPNDGVVFDPSADVEAPAVTVTNETGNQYPSRVTLRLAVNNEGRTEPPITDTMTIDVYDDACIAAVSLGLGELDPSDLNCDCNTDFTDFALMAATWLEDYALTEPVPK